MKPVLDAATRTPNLGGPTDPLHGRVAASSTDDKGLVADETSVLIYCDGEPYEAPRWGRSFALCRCGELVRVVW